MPSEPQEYLILDTKARARGGYALWWGPDERGYYAELEAAGRYTRAEAERICSALHGDALAVHIRDALSMACTVVEYNLRLIAVAVTKHQTKEDQNDA